MSSIPWDILWLQKAQLSRDNASLDVLDVSGLKDHLAELSAMEGDQVPFVVRTGPMAKPDPGVMKNYRAIEINGSGRAFVMVWIQDRLVASGVLFAQEGPKLPRRLNIPRGLGNGYAIDLYIAMQGRLTGYEVFFDIVSGEDA